MISFWKNEDDRKKDAGPSRSEGLVAANQALLDAIDSLMLGEKNQVFENLFLPLIHRYASFVLDLPASEFHHHSKNGGLFTHSLEVVLTALERFEQHLVQETNPDGSLNTMATLQRKHRWQFGVAVAGLLHDLGKVIDMEVTAAGLRWDPLVEGLERFLDCVQAGEYAVHWREGRRPGEHESWTVLFAASIVRPEEVSFAGVGIWTEVLDALARQPQRTNRIAVLIQGADQKSAKKGISLEHAKAPVPEAGNRDKAAAVLDAIRILHEKGELPINRRRSPVYVLETKTACVVPAILESVRPYLKGEGVSLPKDNIRIYDLLQDRGFLETRNNQAVFSITFNPDGGKPYDLKVILIKNEFLWGQHRPALYTGTVEGLEIEAEETSQETEEPKRPS